MEFAHALESVVGRVSTLPKAPPDSRRKRVTGIGATLALVLLGFAGVALPLQAHPFLHNTFSGVIQDDRLMVRVTSTVREVAVTQGVDLEQATRDLSRITSALPGHGEYLLEHLDIRSDGVPLAGIWLDGQLLAEEAPEVPGVPDPMTEFERTRTAFDFEYRLPGTTPTVLTLSHRVLEEHPYAPGVPWEVTYTVEVRDGHRRILVRDVLQRVRVLTVECRTDESDPAIAEATSPRVMAVPEPAPARSYLRLGWHHVLTGYDHLLFLAALALGTRRLVALLRILLVFTAAHSITVTLATLGWIRAPASLVEPVIAASIIAAAFHTVVLPLGQGDRTRLPIAFVFGLVHGLGFAGGLREALPGSGVWPMALAIGAFCIGVELAHLAVGIPLFGVLLRLRQRAGGANEARWIRWGSGLVAAGGGWFLWMALRAGGG